MLSLIQFVWVIVKKKKNSVPEDSSQVVTANVKQQQSGELVM